MSKIYGYCRISTAKQSIERQERNIKAKYPEAVIMKEIFTGTKIEGRKVFEKLLRGIESGDTIVFDSVSRMSRDADEGYALYEELYKKGINLVFLKEPHINTETYKSALSNQIELVGDDVDEILQGINRYLLRLARRQIKLAFAQSEKEVQDLRQRTREGIETARLNGKQIGTKPDSKRPSKKSVKAKEMIRKYHKLFGGMLNDQQTCDVCGGLSRTTLIKYKKEMLQEMNGNEQS